jgi:hypothetical protein
MTLPSIPLDFSVLDLSVFYFKDQITPWYTRETRPSKSNKAFPRPPDWILPLCLELQIPNRALACTRRWRLVWATKAGLQRESAKAQRRMAAKTGLQMTAAKARRQNRPMRMHRCGHVPPGARQEQRPCKFVSPRRRIRERRWFPRGCHGHREHRQILPAAGARWSLAVIAARVAVPIHCRHSSTLPKLDGHPHHIGPQPSQSPPGVPPALGGRWNKGENSFGSETSTSDQSKKR